MATPDAVNLDAWICGTIDVSRYGRDHAPYAALLRGIAPSGTNMTNEKLPGVFERLGSKPWSVLASGNIASAAPTRRTLLSNGSRMRSPVTWASRAEPDPRRTLLDSQVCFTHGRGTMYAMFLKDVNSDVIERLDREVVLHDTAAGAVLAITDNSVPGTTPDFMSWLGRCYGKDITTRSWLTVQRVVRSSRADSLQVKHRPQTDRLGCTRPHQTRVRQGCRTTRRVGPPSGRSGRPEGYILSAATSRDVARSFNPQRDRPRSDLAGMFAERGIELLDRVPARAPYPAGIQADN